MCIVVCIGMFFDFIFINKIIVLMLFIGSYYRTISSHYVLRPLRKPRFSSRAARILFDSGLRFELLLGSEPVEFTPITELPDKDFFRLRSRNR